MWLVIMEYLILVRTVTGLTPAMRRLFQELEDQVVEDSFNVVSSDGPQLIN